MSGTDASAKEARVRRMAPVLGIVAFCLIVWRGTVSNGYVWHDYPYIVANLALRETSNAWACFTDPAASVAACWPDARPVFSPIRNVSFLADFALSHGMDAGWRHTHSLLLHVVNVLLVLALGRRLGLGPGAACFAALLFGVHPAQTESVCWISRRDTLLATGLGLAAILVWLGGRERPFAFGRGMAVSGLSLAACLANAQAIALPVLIVMLDRARGGESARWRGRVWPTVAALAGSGALALLWRGAFASATPGVTNLPEVAGEALRGLSRALELLLFPRVLIADYARADEASAAMALLSACLAVLVAALAVRLWRVDPIAASGLGWVLVAVAASWLDRPESGFAEHRLYFAVVGFALTVSRLVSRLAVRPLVSVSVAMGLLIAASVRTAVRVPDWADDARALNSVLDRAPENWVVLRRLMEANFMAGEYAKASILAGGIVEQADRDPSIPPRVRTECRRYLGASCVATGALEEGRAHLALALEDPAYGWTHFDLGMLAGQIGQPDEAIRCFRQAARLMPLEPLAHFNLGVALREQGRAAEAEEAFRKAARHEWRTAEAYRSLAALLWQREGRMADVVAAYRQAVRLFPRDEVARYWLARAEAGWTNSTFATSGGGR
jgi:tetratricopeptide (TPR) repeat protein